MSQAMVLQSSKSVPSSKQNKSRRSLDTAKSRDVASKSRNSRSNPQKPSSEKPAPKKKKKKPKDPEQESSAQIQEPVRRIIKPKNQLELSENELEEDITRILTGDDPNKPKNVCKFSYKDKCFKPDPPGQGDNMAIHFSLEGCSMHVDSDECKKYREREREQDETDVKVTADSQTTTSSGTSTASISTSTGVDRTKNQFNFSERASQTFNNPLKAVACTPNRHPSLNTKMKSASGKYTTATRVNFSSIKSIDKQDGSARNISFEDKLASIVLASKEASSTKTDTIHSESMEVH